MFVSKRLLRRPRVPETERLSDWMQQADINIKAAKTSLLGTLEEKQKAVRDMEDLHGRIEKGKEDFEKYSQMAEKMRSSCLEANVFTQLRETQAKFNSLLHFVEGVSQKIGSIHEQHYEFEENAGLAKRWMEQAWQTISLFATRLVQPKRNANTRALTFECLK